MKKQFISGFIIKCYNTKRDCTEVLYERECFKVKRMD